MSYNISLALDHCTGCIDCTIEVRIYSLSGSKTGQIWTNEPMGLWVIWVSDNDLLATMVRLYVFSYVHYAQA